MTTSGTASAMRRLLRWLPEHDPSAPPAPDLEEYYQERYADSSGSWKRNLYYRLKPLIPRPVQLALRRSYVSRQAKQSFPAWPVETRVPDLVAAYVRQFIARLDGGSLRRVGFWPDGKRAALVLTHDVEWDAGLRQAPALAAIEKRLGFTSCWNLVPERYPIDWSIVDALRSEGHEVGIHGLKHDGRLFQSRAIFEDRMRQIASYAEKWRAAGFRSPSMLRNAAWMTSLPFEYDSSFPDTDPYEPQPGGCCSPWPYFMGNVVELPLTMPQDHTLFEILGRDDIAIWKQKAGWLMQVGGIIVLNVHPDYMTTPRRLGLYESLLEFLWAQEGVWHALPRTVAAWWRKRDAMTFASDRGAIRLTGADAGRAGFVRCTLRGSALVEIPEPAVKAPVKPPRAGGDTLTR